MLGINNKQFLIWHTYHFPPVVEANVSRLAVTQLQQGYRTSHRANISSETNPGLLSALTKQKTEQKLRRKHE